jgi:hypothetical protein
MKEIYLAYATYLVEKYRLINQSDKSSYTIFFNRMKKLPEEVENDTYGEEIGERLTNIHWMVMKDLQHFGVQTELQDLKHFSRSYRLKEMLRVDKIKGFINEI